MVYLWHPDALDTFDNHLGSLSAFYSTTDTPVLDSGDTWITSVTIKHWRLLDDQESTIREAEKDIAEDDLTRRQTEHEKRKLGVQVADEKEKRLKKQRRTGTATAAKTAATGNPTLDETNAVPFPPDTIRDHRLGSALLERRPKGAAQSHLSKIHELGLSLVITGDEMGRSWTCTVICELFDEAEVAMYALKVSEILQMFIHQQEAARSLAFLLLLGEMCLKLSRECTKFMLQMDEVMHLTASKNILDKHLPPWVCY